MRVQVRVLGAAGAVLVGGGDETDGMLATPPLRLTPDHACFVLEIGEGRLPGARVRLVDGPAGLLVAERVQQADALRDAEDEVEAGDGRELLRLDDALVCQRVDPLDRDPPCPSVPAQLRIGVRVVAADQPPELALLHEPFELELTSAATYPDAG